MTWKLSKQSKVEQRAPEVEIETKKREAPKVVKIMDALKKSMQAGKCKRNAAQPYARRQRFQRDLDRSGHGISALNLA
jgi:non-homologous end joining protein Ku